MLLLFFSGPIDPAIPIGEAVVTAPAETHGYIIDRDAAGGAWRFALELGDPAAGDAFTWFDITEFYAGDSYQRGANEYLGKYAAAVAQVQLQTDNDQLAPWGQDTTPLFGVDVPLDAGLLMRLGMFRVVSGVTVEWNPIWTGRVETWGDASAARGQIRTHVITVTDTIADLANLPTINLISPGITTEEFLADNAHWLYGVDVYGDQVLTIGFDDTPKAAITRMDDATDAFGCVWRSRRDGRLLVYPAPWDTTNVDRWPNPLLDSYPSGLVFSFSPDFTDIAYIDDDDQTSFGIQRTSLGVLNSFTVTTPADLFLLDDPVSIARYGWRPFTATWAGSAVEQVVQDLLDARAYSSAQALPLRTTSDHEGFYSAMALVDHLDPVTIIHSTNPDDGQVVTATGVVRNVTEQRTVRGDGLLSWQSTVQIDLDATDTSAGLLPVENLALVSMNSPLLGGPSSAEFSWANPVQPSITPTDVQLRVLGRSIIWFDTDYPGVGADGTVLGFLSAATPYTLQVRLIRRVNGVITAFSPIRELDFTTPALIVPVITPGDEGDDGTNVGIPPDFGCDTEWHIEENDGTGWTVFQSGDQNDLVLGGDGLYHLPYDIDNGDFDPDNTYRVCYRVDCGDGFGPWICGAPTTIPADWSDPCTDPPALGESPWDDPDLIVYIPKVCAPDIIREAVSGLEATKGDALAGLLQTMATPARFALEAIDDPEWSDTPGGIVAYGECPQIVGETGDKSIGVYVQLADTTSCVLFECAGMRLLCTNVSPTTWRATVVVYKANGTTITLPTLATLAVDTPYHIYATHDTDTGDTQIAIEDIVDNSVGGSDNILTTTVLPIWRVGVPPGSWITDCAVWSKVLTFTPQPPSTDLIGWWDASDTTSLTLSGSEVTQWNDKSGSGFHLTRDSGQTGPVSGARTRNGLNVLDFNGDNLKNVSLNNATATGWTMFVVCVQDTTPGSPFISVVSQFQGGTESGLRITNSAPEMVSTSGGTAVVTGSAYTNTNWRQITGQLMTGTNNQTLRQNGSAVGATTPFSPFSISETFWVGSTSGGFRPLDGAIAEILLYRPFLGSTQRDAVEAYLVAKWGTFP